MSQAIPIPDADLGQRMLRLRLAVVESIKLEDLAAIFAKLIERAVSGCFQSMKLVLGYTLGRPGPIQTAWQRGRQQVDDAPTVNKRSETAPPPPAPVGQRAESVSTPAPSATAPELTPEMQAYLRQPFTCEELDEARRTSVLFGKKPTVNKR